MSGPFENDSVTADDHWDYPSAAEDRASYTYKYKPTKTCKHCGNTGLRWAWTGSKQGWRLSDNSGAIHECKPKKSSCEVHKLLSYAIGGMCMTKDETEEYRKLVKHFKDNGLTVDQLLKG